jgi:iron complex transport system substrate-binding protein
MRRIFLTLLLLCALMPRGWGATLTDATGRRVEIPDHVGRVLPAGEPAAVLLAALAPDLMLGWPMPLGADARAALGPAAAALPEIPRLTGHADVTAAIRALAPDLIVDYGTVSAAYVALAERTQATTGVPTVLLDGALKGTPAVLRALGAVLHRGARAELLARLAEALLALPAPGREHKRVLYARGTDTLLAVAGGTDTTEAFDLLGWTVLAPPGRGEFRPITREQIDTLDPDIIVFGDPAMRRIVAAAPAWRVVRAVREGHALFAPARPFGWVEQPPSLNRLLGLAWLGGHDPVLLGAMFGAVVYGRAPTTADLAALAEAAQPLPP